MRAKITISDMKGSESRSKVVEFADYGELNTLTNEFEESTGFARLEVQIEPAGDEELDTAILDRIADGTYE